MFKRLDLVLITSALAVLVTALLLTFRKPRVRP